MIALQAQTRRRQTAENGGNLRHQQKKKKKPALLNAKVCSQQNHGNFVKVKSFRIWSFFSQRSAPSLLHRGSSGQTDLCWESLQFKVFLRSFYGGPEVPQLEYFRWGSRRFCMKGFKDQKHVSFKTRFHNISKYCSSA